MLNVEEAMEAPKEIHHIAPTEGTPPQDPSPEDSRIPIAVANTSVEGNIEALDTVVRLIRENTQPATEEQKLRLLET